MLTEGRTSLLPEGGHVVEGTGDWGYGRIGDRRKVLLWSRRPWRSLDRLGHRDLPPGRYVEGVTDTPGGPLRVVGASVPWADAHVRTGARDRTGWQDHVAYLGALQALLGGLGTDVPTLVAGDLNQAPSGRRPPAPARDALAGALAGFRVVTAGTLRGLERPGIDHVALGPGLVERGAHGWPRRDGDLRLSDHDGAAVELRVHTLERDGRTMPSLRAGSYAGVRTTGVFGRLTCGSGRRALPAHRVFFARWDDALAAGYRPCGNCRPRPDDHYARVASGWVLAAA